MKHCFGTAFLLIGLIFLVPWLMGSTAPSVVATANSAETAETIPQEISPSAAMDASGVDSTVTLRVKLGDTVERMDMATYLLGVLRAEMPAAFEPEALKAQAVAARTYTLYRMEQGTDDNHPHADTCDDITCCKAYLSLEDAAVGWGDDAAFYEEKLRQAVEQTDGECVLYDGIPILAVFHSSSAGATLDAAEVWSSSVPYLQSVASPENGETVPNYRTEVRFTAAELRRLLLEHYPAAQLEGNASNWFTNLRQSAAGAVVSITVGGTAVKGNDLRTVLGLRSPCFTFSFSGEEVVFTSTGYGHGVGMSQYGANVLALEGMSYEEILTWYYTDTEVAVYLP